MAGRKMPQNIEAEMSVLAACLLMKSAADKVCEDMIPDMFFSDANRKIFEAIYNLHENKKPIDIKVGYMDEDEVSEWLKKHQ